MDVHQPSPASRAAAPVPKARVREVSVPAGSLALAAFPVTHYADAFALTISDGAPTDVDSLLRVLNTCTPRCIEWLMFARNRIVSLIGLKAPSARPRSSAPAAFKPGDRASSFEVFDRTEQEILMGGDDRHLDFRAALLVREAGVRREAVLSTVVHYNGRLGCVYFFFVRPFHRVIVPSILRALDRKLTAPLVPHPPAH